MQVHKLIVAFLTESSDNESHNFNSHASTASLVQFFGKFTNYKYLTHRCGGLDITSAETKTLKLRDTCWLISYVRFVTSARARHMGHLSKERSQAYRSDINPPTLTLNPYTKLHKRNWAERRTRGCVKWCFPCCETATSRNRWRPKFTDEKCFGHKTLTHSC